jgi:hypothetical protein
MVGEDMSARVRVVAGASLILVTAALAACGSGGSSAAGPVAQASSAAPAPGSASAAASSSPSFTGSAPASASWTPSASPSTSSPAAPQEFELNQSFNDFQTTTDLTADEEQSSYQHVLFEINPGGSSYVIDGNLSPTPVPATVTANSDGSTGISYSEQVSSMASTSVSFQGTLTGSTMQATVNVDQSGGDVVDHTEYLGASSGSASFTTTISPVSPDDIPAPPAGGTCGFSSDYGVTLSWSPPSQGPSVSDYDLYESVAGLAPPVFYLTRVNGTSYDDESAVTKGHDADVLPYYVYAVGPTGIESLTPLVLTLSSLPAGLNGAAPQAFCSAGG